MSYFYHLLIYYCHLHVLLLSFTRLIVVICMSYYCHLRVLLLSFTFLIIVICMSFYSHLHILLLSFTSYYCHLHVLLLSFTRLIIVIYMSYYSHLLVILLSFTCRIIVICLHRPIFLWIHDTLLVMLIGLYYILLYCFRYVYTCIYVQWKLFSI